MTEPTPLQECDRSFKNMLITLLVSWSVWLGLALWELSTIGEMSLSSRIVVPFLLGLTFLAVISALDFKSLHDDD